METGIPSDQMALLHDGRRLSDDRSQLKDLGIKEDDVLLVQPLTSGPVAPPPAGQCVHDIVRIVMLESSCIVGCW